MKAELDSGLPVLRLVHQMARSGGTIICRCLASMQGIVLLSEIHPLGLRTFNPLQQAAEWHGLLTSRDLQAAHAGKFTFPQAIRLISQRCEEQGLTLVLRDWSHLDYTGVPFVRPGFRSLLAEALQPEFRLQRYSTVRHPLDQWLSLSREAIYREKLDPARYWRGFRRFAEAASATGFIRYEDFTADPDRELKRLCAGLQMEFDSGYRDRWRSYTHITGDVLPGRAGQDIISLPRQHMEEPELLQFQALPRYQSTIASLGYEA